MAELEKSGKPVTFINGSRNPHRMKNSAGEVVMVMPGQPISVTAEFAKQVKQIRGFMDASKFVKPEAADEALKKECEDLKVKCDAQAKEIEDLKKALEAAKKK